MKKSLLFASALTLLASTVSAQSFKTERAVGLLGKATVAAETPNVLKAAPSKAALADNQRYIGLYSTDDLSEYGYGFASLSMDVGLGSYWPASVFNGTIGMQAKAMRVGLCAAATVKKVSIYGVNAAGNITEIKSQTPSSTSFSKGWTTVNFDEAWTVDTTGYSAFLVGYTYTQKKGSTNDCYPWSLVQQGTTEPTYAYGNLGTKGEGWYDIGTESYGNLSVQLLVEGNFPTYSAIPEDFAKINAVVNDTATVTINFKNMGKDPITDLDYTATIDGVAGESVHQTFATSVAAGAEGSFSFKVPTGSEAAIKKVAVEITKVNGQDNGSADKVANGEIGVAKDKYARNVVIEEFTTEKCPNCPRVAGFLHTALETADPTRVFAVCHHSGYYTDWLTQTCDNDLQALFNDGGYTYAPAVMYNRRPYFTAQYPEGTTATDNMTIPTSANEITQLIAYESNLLSDAKVSLTAVPNADTTQVVLTVNGECNEAFDNANNYLTVYMTEDNIKAQSQSGATGTFYHQHVIRYFNSSWGDAVTWTDKKFTKTYTIDVKSTYKKADLKFVAFLNKHNTTNVLDNAIENGNGVSLIPATTGISGVTTNAANVYVVARYNAAGQMVNGEQKGLNIVKMSNGKVIKYIK